MADKKINLEAIDNICAAHQGWIQVLDSQLQDGVKLSVVAGLLGHISNQLMIIIGLLQRMQAAQERPHDGC